MIGAVEAEAKPVLDALMRVGLANTATVVLVGSGARGVRNARSDIDILVLHDDDGRIRLKRPGDIHLQQTSRSRFLERLENGDDYPSWALRLGVSLHDPDGWWAEQVAAELGSPHWPDWRVKVGHARKRMRMASELLDTGDVDAASEEFLFAASHVARAALLRCGVFPLSRPELPRQTESDDPDLARLLERLIGGDIDPAGLRSAESLLEQRLDQLSNARTETVRQ